MSASYNSYISYPALIYSMAALKRGGSGAGMNPYEYAKSIGYTGTKEEFGATLYPTLFCNDVLILSSWVCNPSTWAIVVFGYNSV